MTVDGPVLVVDAANVVGSRPDGWWRDRSGAARRLRERLGAVGASYDEVVLVLEGAARGGVAAGADGPLLVVHAPGEGDDTILAEAADRVARGNSVVVVTADRALRARVEGLGATCRGPGWLLDQT